MAVARHLKLKNLETINKRSAQLGCLTYNTTSATLTNTTQLAQSLQTETTEYMRHYIKLEYGHLSPID